MGSDEAPSASRVADLARAREASEFGEPPVALSLALNTAIEAVADLDREVYAASLAAKNQRRDAQRFFAELQKRVRDAAADLKDAAKYAEGGSWDYLDRELR